MKKTLLYLILPMLFAATSVNAQIKVWDFGGATVEDFGGYTFQNMINITNVGGVDVIPQNAWYAVGTTAGATAVNLPAAIDITTGLLRWTGGVNSDRLRVLNTAITRWDTGASAGTGNYSYLTGRIYVNSAGATSRGLWVTLTAGQEITLIARADADGGTLNFGTETASLNLAMTEYHFTATTAGEYQIFGSVGKPSFYRLYLGNVTTPTTNLATKSFQKELDITVYAKQNKIFLSNLKSKTQVNVYNVLGALVKTAQVDSDSSLDINSGVYIVNAKSADGEKSVKVIVQ
jgi:hypothetical protein